jgi:putative heme-binding domain-containing protein
LAILDFQSPDAQFLSQSKGKMFNDSHLKNNPSRRKPFRFNAPMRFFITSLTALFSLLSLRAQNQPAPIVQMLVPGFVVEELPVKLSNQNNLRFAPDGALTSLGYDGRIWRLRDTNNDGLEDKAEPFWTNSTLSVPLGMAWSPEGLYVSSKGKVSLLKDTNKDGLADDEEIITSGWPATDVGSGGVDATAVTLDAEGNLYFGLLVADYSNAYRLRKRKDLKPAEIEWLKTQGKWGEGSNSEDEFSLYDLNSPRGTIQKWDRKTKKLSTIATGIRVPVALAFNKAGDLFNTDQEGETWMPGGNPLDELNHIRLGHNYGFPPRHDKWLPNLQSDPPIVAFGPQHQSACGLIFDDPRPNQPRFGPEAWEGNAFVAGESRAKIWRVQLQKTGDTYSGSAQTIARLTMLTMDLAISPKGALYVACHSGPPDWGTGPQGAGKIFRITYKDTQAPIPLTATPTSPTEVRITFDRPLTPEMTRTISGTNVTIEFGEYVTAGDRFEKLKPPYAVVGQQDATPRGRLGVHSATLIPGVAGKLSGEENRTLILKTDPHPFATHYAITLPINGSTIDLDYDLSHSILPWAPKARASAGTDSRPPTKPDGDWQHGREMFFSEQLQCSKCHRIRGEGGTAGPDLSNLIHRDMTSILRDIREPSATIHPDYVTFQVTMKDGEVIQGFIRAQQENSLQLFDAFGKETTLRRADIEKLQPTESSLMPLGLLEGKKETDIRDLLTFLLWEPPKHTAPAITKHTQQINRELRLVLVASKQDHGADQHDYPNWQTNWSRLLSNPEQKITVQTAWEWPTQTQFDSASAIVFYFWNHNWSPERLAQIDAYLKRGRGIALIHSAVIADKDPEQLAERIGLSAHPQRTGYRHMPFELQINKRDHPIMKGLPERMNLLDEPYWPLIGNTNHVQTLASAKIDGQSRPLIWTQQKGEGRIFASIPGHYTWTLNDPLFRTILLRGIAWVAGDDINRLLTPASAEEIHASQK